MTLFIQRPLVPLACGALIGCVLGTRQCFVVSPWMGLAIAGVCLGLAWWQKQNILGTISIVGAVVALFYAIGIHYAEPAPDHIKHFGNRRDITVQGCVQGFLQPTRIGKQWQGRLRCEKVIFSDREYTVSGSIRIVLPQKAGELNQGDSIKIRGTLATFNESMNPGEFNYAAYMQQQDIYSQLRVHVIQDVVCLQAVSRYSPGYWVQWLHRKWRQSIQRYVPDPEKNIVLAIVLGIRSGLTSWQRTRIANAGLAHVLAISGMHVGIVFMLLLGCLRVLRVPVRYGMFISLLSVYLFAGITGAQVPVLRSCVMLTCISLVYVVLRPADGLSGLALALILLLLQNPRHLYAAGFQLSFIATYAILVVLPWLRPLQQVKNRVGRWILQAICISSGILLFTAPLTLFHFYQFSPITILTNLAAIPLLVSTLVTGVLVGISASVCPALATLSGKLSAWSCYSLEKVAMLTEYIPGSVWYGWAPSVFWILCYLSAVLIILWSKRWRWLSGVFLVGLICLYFRSGPLAPKEFSVRATYFSLGIGESTLLETHSGKRILIDLGTEQEFFWRIRPLLASRGIQSLDAVIISHADFDHAGGLLACMSFFKVKQIIHTHGLATNKTRRMKSYRLIVQKNIASCVMYQGDQKRIDNTLWLEALWPPIPYTAHNNKFCLVVLIHTPGGRLLFPGDCPGSIETGWPQLPRVRVLKVGHHGDRESSADTFLAQIRPEMAVICPGQNNCFGLPDQETGLRLRSWGAVVANTAACGALTVVITPNEELLYWSW
jgi:competence protein ComEC